MGILGGMKGGGTASLWDDNSIDCHKKGLFFSFWEDSRKHETHESLIRLNFTLSVITKLHH